MEKNVYVRKNKSKLILGVLLILAGIFFVGLNVGLIPYNINKIIFSWPMLLIVLGLIGLFKNHVFSGLVLSLTGVFFLIPRLALIMPDTFYWVSENFTSTYWPVLLILLGIFLIIYWIVKPSKGYEFYHQWEKKKKFECKKKGAFSGNTVFGNGEHIILDEEFKGGEVNAVFGGITLDLRKTKLPEGETILEINSVFGGIVVLVPQGWNIDVHVDSVLGGFNDERTENDAVYDKTRKLIIKGACVFGGAELKN